MYGYIYLTINKINHKTYVGQRKLRTKTWDRDSYLGSGKYLQCAIKKYGKENFEKFLIQYCDTKEDLDKQEIFWIAEYRKRDMAQYNITDGGKGFKGVPAWNRGRKMDQIFCEKCRERAKGNHSALGHKMSEESKKKWKETKIKNGTYRIRHTKEQTAAISRANTGKKWFNNDIENRFCFECPAGFHPGMINQWNRNKTIIL